MSVMFAQFPLVAPELLCDMFHSLAERGRRRLRITMPLGTDVVSDMDGDAHPVRQRLARECHVSALRIGKVLVDGTAESLLHVKTQRFTDVCLMACDGNLH